MSIDANLLKIMKHRSKFERLFHQIPHGVLDKSTMAVLKIYARYFKTVPDEETITFEKVMARIRVWHPNTDEEKLQLFAAMFREAQGEVSPEAERGILADLLELALATKTMNTIQEYHGGMLQTPLVRNIETHLDEYRMSIGYEQHKESTDSIVDILSETGIASGLEWSLQCLRDSTRPLQGGDFGIIAARPDAGKTGFIISQVVHFAKQLDDTQNILWLNNEGTHRAIIVRLYQSALGIDRAQLEEYAKDGSAIGRYESIVGRQDKIRVLNIHGKTMHDVSNLLKENNPKVVVYDMIDNIGGFNSEGREDARLEKLYQWAREKCVEHNCVGIAASQISADGEGLKFPALDMLKESKTAKQGACDFQLMIGKYDADVYRNSRFLSLPKNKLKRPGQNGDPRAEVRFLVDKVQFLDINSGDAIVDAPIAESTKQEVKTADDVE